MLAYEKDFAPGNECADLSRDLNAIQSREADVQQNQIGLQLCALADCFQSVRRFADDPEFPAVLQYRGNQTAPGLEIINNQNANWRQLLNGLPRFKVQQPQ